MENMESNRLTEAGTQVLGFLKLLDESPGFAGFDIEHWIESAETAMTKCKKRGYEDAFSEDVPVDERELSFQVAKTMMETYASGDYKFSERVRGIIKEQGVEFLNRKCTHQIAWTLRPKSSDKTSENESAETSDSSVAPGLDTKDSMAKGSADKLSSKDGKKAHGTKKINTKDRPIKRYMVYRTINGEKKLIFFKLAKGLGVMMNRDHKDPNRNINNDPKRHLHGFDYQGPPSLPADEISDLEPFPEYVEPDPAEFGLIAEDILEVGASNEGASSSSSDSSTIPSDANDESSGSEEVVNFQPLNKKPRFKFSPSSSLSSRLPDFLASIKAANDNLQTDISAGKQDHLLEIEDATEDDGQEERPYIEMDLGLGVLEETANHSDSSDNTSNEAGLASDSSVATTSGKSNTKKTVIIEEL